MDRHTVIIPTYNERENIKLLVEGVMGLGLGSQIVIVDDKSPDGTEALADSLAVRYSAIRVIHRPEKLGLGTAHIAGMNQALAQGAKYILTMDADFSHHPRDLPELLAMLLECDMVIGSRYVQGGDTLYCAASRRALGRGANRFARGMLKLQAGDATAGFRGYRRVVLESIALDDILSDGYSFLVEMLYRCQKQGWRVGEVPIIFENRQRGASKISKAEIFKAMRAVIQLRLERRQR